MQNSYRRLLLAALFAVVPAAASAQGGGAAPKKIAAGTYQIVPDSNFSGGFDVTGFTMRFDGDSLMMVEQNGTMMTRSRIAYEGENLTWSDLEGELMCPGTAKYKLVFSEGGSKIRLTPVEDGCAERSAIIAQISLVRKTK